MNIENQSLPTTTETRLGAHQKTFRPRGGPGKVMLGAAIFCFFMSVIMFISAVNKYSSPPSTLDMLSDRYRQDAIMIRAVLGVVFVLIAALLIALYYTHIKGRVDLHVNGFVVTTWRGSTSFLWDEILDVEKTPIYGRGRYGRRPVNWTYTITRDDGEKAQFRGLEGLMVLGRVIEQKIGNG